MANFILPYEPQSAEHREAERRHRETQKWLRRRTIEIATRVRSIMRKATPEDDKSEPCENERRIND
jgi:hypothetical protein